MMTSEVSKNSNENIYHFPRKPISQVFSECIVRVKNLKNSTELEKNTLIAICNGDMKEADRLLDIAKKMKKNHIKLI